MKKIALKITLYVCSVHMSLNECIWLYFVIVIIVFDDDTCTAVKGKSRF